MRFKGVRVDLEKASNIKKNLMDRESKIVNKIKDLTGVDVEIHAARSIAKAFDKLKLPYDRTEKVKNQVLQKLFTKPSTRITKTNCRCKRNKQSSQHIYRFNN
ncbi:MAG: hypothetical protein CM15mV131_330 [uncultured marine virus]|nr:MAG: hypothetical protein CM15mV131_330 [uncultured marine virus]